MKNGSDFKSLVGKITGIPTQELAEIQEVRLSFTLFEAGQIHRQLKSAYAQMREARENARRSFDASQRACEKAFIALSSFEDDFDIALSKAGITGREDFVTIDPEEKEGA